MASGAGELAAWHVAKLIAFLPFTATALSPLEINPYGEQDAPVKSKAMAELEAWQKRRKWKVLHS